MTNSWDTIIDTDIYKINRSRLETYAFSKGYRLNPDTDRLKKVVGLMTLNKLNHGDYYCPCKQNHPLKKTDIICPCVEAGKEISETGHCYCKLFYKID